MLTFVKPYYPSFVLKSPYYNIGTNKADYE